MSRGIGTSRVRRVFLVLGVGCVVLGLLLAAGQLVAANYKGATFKCLVEGPSSPLAEMSERADIVTGHAVFWPLGRECQWDRADGAGTVTTYSGSWPATVAALALLVGGFVLVLVLSLRIVPEAPKRPGLRRVL